MAQQLPQGLTQTRCYKTDRALIQALSAKLSAATLAKFNSEHVVHRALLTLSNELKIKLNNKTDNKTI